MAPPFVLIECPALRPGFAHGNDAHLTAPKACEQALDVRVNAAGLGYSASSVYSVGDAQKFQRMPGSFVTIYLQVGLKTFHGLRKYL